MTPLCAVARTSRGQSDIEGLFDKLLRTLTGAIVLSDPLVDHPTGLVENEDRRVCDTELMVLSRHAESRMMRSQLTIQQTKLGDHVTTHVRQKWKADAFGGGEPIQDFGRVVADPDQPYLASLELLAYICSSTSCALQ